jgi:predicted acylesterase/phospholipase RssA
VQASSALPGLYPPVEVRDRHFVDGALRRTMHASVALEQDIDLLLGLNPLVPFDASRARAEGKPQPESLVTGGLPMVLSQTFRTLLQSRVQVGLAKYAQQYEAVDQLVFEPNADDAEMFFTNVFSYSSRQRVCEHAYLATLADLRARREQLGPLLARHGLHLRDDVLDDANGSLFDGLSARRRHRTQTTAKLARALDDVEGMLRKRR